MSVDSIQAIE